MVTLAGQKCIIMIRKLLFASILGGFFALSNAQVQVWKDDFNDEDVSDWTRYDDDGDGFNWGDLFQVTNDSGTPVTPVSLISRSWQGVPLTPDNWIISPPIDIRGAGGTLTLSWITQVAAASWDMEHYSVYVGTSPDRAVLVDSPVSVTTTLGQGTNAGTPVSHTLDLTALINEPTIYVALRHYDCTDQDYLSVDDITVTATTMAVSNASKNSLSIYPNPATDVVNIKTDSKVNSVEVYDLAGKKINVNFADNKVNVADLAKGNYILKVNDDKGSSTLKFIKK